MGEANIEGETRRNETMRNKTLAIAISLAVALASPTQARTEAPTGPTPSIERCVDREVAQVRDGGEWSDDSEYTILYRDGMVSEMRRRAPAGGETRAGDHVRSCVVAMTHPCRNPRNGVPIIRSTNERTGRSWNASGLPTMPEPC